MAFALKASPTAHALNHPTRRGSSPAVLVATRGRLVVRAAPASAPASFKPAVVFRAPPSVPAAFVPVADLSVARTLNRVKEQGKVLLTTPATPAERMKKITNASEGFVYLVSVNGVTGPRTTVNPRVKDLLKEIKQVTDKAVVVGFGISTPDHVRQIAEWGADGIIVGSAMVKPLGEEASPREGLKRLQDFARSLKDALK